MRKTYIAILGLILSILLNIAVSADPSDSTISTRQLNKWHLLFATGGYLLPVTYMDKSIGIQYSFAPDKAIRFSFGLEYGDSSLKRIEYYDQLGVIQRYDTNDRKWENRLATFYLYYIKYFGNNKTLMPYYGGGSFFKYSTGNYNSEHTITISDTVYTKSTSNYPNYSTGFIFLIGAQYRISDHIQLHANYDLRIAYARYDQRNYSESSNGDNKIKQLSKSKSESFSLNSDYLNLGLSIGF